MSRLIPGRIRNQGIELYNQGSVSLVEEKDHIILAQVGDCHLQFSFNDDLISCPC